MIDNITVSRSDSVGMRLDSVMHIRLATDNIHYVNFGMNKSCIRYTFVHVFVMDSVTFRYGTWFSQRVHSVHLPRYPTSPHVSPTDPQRHHTAGTRQRHRSAYPPHTQRHHTPHLPHTQRHTTTYARHSLPLGHAIQATDVVARHTLTAPHRTHNAIT